MNSDENVHCRGRWKRCGGVRIKRLRVRVGHLGCFAPKQSSALTAIKGRTVWAQINKRAAQLIERRVPEGMKLCGEVFWPGILTGYSGEAFCVARYSGKVFCVARDSSKEFWQGILARYSGKVFWQDILARYSGEVFWQDILALHSGEVFWRDIFLEQNFAHQTHF
jgi:hypothetical protein